MKKIILIGKLNDMVKDLNVYLSGFYHVQLCSENPSVISGMLEIVKPDLVLISLIGAYDIDTAIFRHLSADYSEIPVLTIGTEREMVNFLKFYDDDQFENLIRPLENAQIREAIQARIGGIEEGESQRKKVLVVDDNPMLLRSVKPMLDETYEVLLASSGMQAMTTIGRSRPDLILLDYEMPVCDGRQTLEMIRANEETASIPVVFLTGVNDREHIEAVLTLHPSGYLLKPPVRDTLLAKVAEVLG